MTLPGGTLRTWATTNHRRHTDLGTRERGLRRARVATLWNREFLSLECDLDLPVNGGD